MRVLMVHPHDVYDPQEPWTVRITSLARCLVDLGHEVRLVYHLARPDLLPGDVRHRQEFPFEVIPRQRHIGLGLRKAQEMTDLAREADLVHVQKALPWAALPAAAAAAACRIPLHYDWDDDEAGIYVEATGQRDRHWRRIDRFERTMPGIAETVSVASQALLCRALGHGVAGARLFLAPVGADPARFGDDACTASLRANLDLPGPVVLYLGQLAGAHAAPLFLDAAALVAKGVPRARFVVVGGGRTLPSVQEHARRLGLDGSVHFLGAVAHDRVPGLLALADVAVATLPDTAQAATKSPLKVVEYMAAGRAIVASAVGETVRFLDHGRVGVLVEPGSAPALAAAIGALLGDPRRRHDLGSAARAHLLRHHTWMHTARVLDRAYALARRIRGLSAGGRPPRRGLGPRGLPEAPLRGVPAEDAARSSPRAPAAPHAPAGPFGAPVQRALDALKGKLDVVGVLDGEWAFAGPHTIQLDLTNRCNNDCIACWLHSPLLEQTGPNAADLDACLDKDVVRVLLDDAAEIGTRDLYLAGGGDPLACPFLREVVQQARGHEMSVAINTNFTMADEEWCDWACEVGLSDLTVSVWAGTAQGYDATHPNKREEDFEELERRLTYLARRKRRVGSGPRVKLYQVVSRLNAHEFESMYEMVERTGSDTVEYTVVDTVPGHTDGLLFDDEVRRSLLGRSLALRERLEARGLHGRLFGFDTWLRRLGCEGATQGLADAGLVHTLPCTVGWTFLRVMPDGRVCSCLKSHRIPIGDIRRERLSDLWNNERQREFRRRTRVTEKRDPWFASIGNDPGVPCGCEKSCDDLGRNQAMERRIQALTATERALALGAARVIRPIGHKGQAGRS